MDFPKKLKFVFLVNLYHFIEHYEVKNYEVAIWSGIWDIIA